MPKGENAHRKAIRRTKRRKNANRRLLGEAIEKTRQEAPDQGPMDPVTALGIVLDRTYSWLVYVQARTEKLPEERFWRKTKTGVRLPNEWIRLERDLRSELTYLSARMLDLDIEDRKAQAAEIVAQIFAPVIGGILKDLQLTKKQRAKVKGIVARHLALVEGGTDPLRGAGD